MIPRRRFLLLAAALLPPAAEEEVLDLLAGMATALSEGNAVQFLEPFDRAMPGFSRLQSDVNALLSQAEVASSIRLTADEGDDRRRSVELDWLLEISSRAVRSAIQRRQCTVRVRLERRGKKWKIVFLEPVDLFAPPAPGR